MKIGLWLKKITKQKVFQINLDNVLSQFEPVILQLKYFLLNPNDTE